MADIIYIYGGSVYLNITNKCDCSCVFCIRRNGASLGSAETLWHTSDPTIDEIKSAIDAFDFSSYKDVIFCGYGEPTCSFENLIATARYIKRKTDLKIRLNTNGLSDMYNKRPTAQLLEGLIDTVSISLNAPDAESYNNVTHPVYGEKAFEAMLAFASECKKYIPSVKMTVVDVISEAQIERCRELADKMNIPLRVRMWEHNS